MTQGLDCGGLKGDDEFPSPATTPGSVGDEEKFLVPYTIQVKRRVCSRNIFYHIPIAILSISVLEVSIIIFQWL